eukprot:TRINITY_DN25283_c0_g1_i1.p1 TRINITY_DN25283_c0_g1~~TRINITY_DN25283_c0_g1_i1.p1  ORF type:complete len:1249 (+),score=439.59 TRINITY_DN25283_c0_g1_i1:2-3748(+)
MNVTPPLPSAAQFDFSSFRRQCADSDPDLKYMALSDLGRMLDTHGAASVASINDNTDPIDRITGFITISTEDDSLEPVREEAAKCMLNLLAAKVLKNEFILRVVVELCKQLKTPATKELKDFQCNFVKSILQLEYSFPDEVDKEFKEKLLAFILERLSSDCPQTEAQPLLLLLAALAGRYGPRLPKNEHAKITELGKKYLLSTTTRAISLLEKATAFISPELLTELMNFLISIMKTSRVEHIKISITCIATLGRSFGFRIGSFVPMIIKELISVDGNKAFFEKHELKEAIVVTLEVLSTNCRKEIAPLAKDINQLLVRRFSYAPEFGEDEEMEEEEEEDSMMEEEDFDDIAEFGEETDEGFRVRRSAATAACTLITKFTKIAPFLISETLPQIIRRMQKEQVGVVIATHATCVEKIFSKISKCKPSEKKGMLEAVQPSLQHLIEVLCWLLKTQKGADIKITIICAFRKICCLQLGVMGKFAAEVVPAIFSTLSEKGSNSALKLESLSFFYAFMQYESQESFAPFLKNFGTFLIQGICNSLTMLSLDSLKSVPKFMSIAVKTGLHGSFVSELFAALDKASNRSEDDVKRLAITCMGEVASILPEAERQAANTKFNILPFILERVKREALRREATKALEVLSLAIDVSPFMSTHIFPEVLNTMSSQDLPTKITGFEALYRCFSKYPNEFSKVPEGSPRTFQTAALALTSSDFALCTLAINVSTGILLSQKGNQTLAEKFFLPHLLSFMKLTPHHQGKIVEALTQFFDAMSTNLDEVKIIDLACKLDDVTLQSWIGAKMVGICSTHVAKPVLRNMVNRYLERISEKGEQSQVAVTTIGEIGRMTNISDLPVLDRLKQFTIADPDEIKIPAAISIGKFVSGCLETGLPAVIALKEEFDRRRIDLVRAAKEIIQHSSWEKLIPHEEQILQSMILPYASNDLPGIRSIVAECIGLISKKHPEKAFEIITKGISSPNPLTRGTQLLAIHYSLLGCDSTSCAKLVSGTLDQLLVHLQYEYSPEQTSLTSSMGLSLVPPLERTSFVRSCALATLKSIISHGFENVPADRRTKLIDAILMECTPNPKFIQIIQLGNTQHIKDEFIEGRKTAYLAAQQLFLNGELPDINRFFVSVVRGLTDRADIASIVFDLVMRQCAVDVNELIRVDEEFVWAIEGTKVEVRLFDALLRRAEKVVSSDSSEAALGATAIKTIVTIAHAGVAQQHFQNIASVIKERADLSSIYDKEEKNIEKQKRNQNA